MKKEYQEKSIKRVWQFDALKLFLIFLVVLGHILEEFIINSCETTNILRLRFWIYTFHMPLFIYISGIFSKKNINEKKYSNITFFLIIYIFYKIILMVTNALLKNTISFSLLSENGVPWYCFAMFAFSLITIFLKEKNKYFIFISSIILGCIVGYDNSIGDYLILSRIIVFYPFFYAGYQTNINKLSKMLSTKKALVLSFIILTIFTLIVFLKINDIYWLSPLLSGRNPFNTLGDKYYLGAPIRYIYYIIVFLINMSFISIFVSLKKERKIYRLGQNTLPIYFFHYIPIRIIFFTIFNPMVWMKKILPIYPTILIFPISLIITVIFAQKIFNKPFELLRKL